MKEKKAEKIKTVKKVKRASKRTQKMYHIMSSDLSRYVVLHLESCLQITKK